MKGKVKSAFSLIIEHVREYTESKTFWVFKTKQSLSIAKLHAFIRLLYTRSAYEAKNINLSYLWNTKWDPYFSRQL